MAEDAACPDEKALMEFVAERLDVSTAGRIHDHLQRCARCGETVTRIRTDLLGKAKDGSDCEPTVSARRPRAAEPSLSFTVDYHLLQEEGFDVSVLDPSLNREALGRLGKYDLLGVLGRGGMGIVFRGYDEQLRRTVAVKVLNRQLAYNATARRRFIREARAAAGINHPNVVTIYAVEEHRDFPFLVMEYVGGGSLRDRIRRCGRLEWLEMLRLSREIAAGLAAAHGYGVIHRDVKPGNVLLEEGAVRVKISDFGLARAAVDSMELTSQAVTVGTPAYMSPEQVSGDEIDSRSDLFGMGCVMYAMVAGHSPFEGNHPLEMARKVAEYDPPPLATAFADTPPFLSEIVARLLEKNAEDRFQSAAEVADLLGRHLAVLNVTPTDKMGVVLQSQPPPKAKRSRLLLRAGAAAMVTLAILSAGVVAWRLNRESGGPAGAPREQRAGTVPQAGRDYPQLIRVAKSDEADVRSIREAISLAGPGTVIRVEDQQTYAESVVLADPQRLRGVSLEARIVPGSGARPTLTASDHATPLIQLRDVSDVVIRGFRMEAGACSAILIAGTVSGVTIDNVQCRQRREGELNPPALLIDATRPAGQDSPIVLCNSVVDNPPRGQCVLVNGASPRAPPIRLEDNRFLGRGVQVLFFAPEGKPVGRVVIAGNLFVGEIEQGPSGEPGRPALNAINLDLCVADPEQEVLIHNNTFLNVKHWIGFVGTAIPGPRMTVCNNLILGSDGIETSAEKVPIAARHWQFASNWWEPFASTPTEMKAGQVSLATVHERIDLLEREDGKDPDFLRPPPGSPLETSGYGKDGLPGHVGARAAQGGPPPAPDHSS